MATRQNKKRKARNNVNRERTVTTLAEDPNTSFLVPMPSEEPPKGAGMPPFSAQGQNSANFQGQPAYSGFATSSYISPMQPPAPFPYYQQQQPNVQLPPGQDDLEILEKLKDMIKNGQHERFRPVANPAALASIYMGPRGSAQNQVPPHPEQVPEHQSDSAFSSMTAYDRRQAGLPSNGASRPRSRTNDSWDASGARKPGAQPLVSGAQLNNNMPQTSQGAVAGTDSNASNSVSDKPGIGLQSSRDMKPPASTTGPDGLQRGSRYENVNHPPSGQSQRREQTAAGRSIPDKPVTGEGSFNARPQHDEAPSKYPGHNGKDGARPEQDSGWARKDVQDDRRNRHEQDRPPPPNGRPPSDVRPNGNDARGPGARDQRFYDRERDRERDRDRDRERDRDFDRDPRERRENNYRPFRDDRRFDDRSKAQDSNVNGNNRRPLSEQRHYEPRHLDPLPPRRYDAKPADEPVSGDRRPEPPSVAPRTGPTDERNIRPAVPPDDRPMRPPVDDRAAPAARPPPPPAEARSGRAVPADDRPVRPVDDRRVAPPPSAAEDRSSIRPSESVSRPAPAPEDRSVRVPPPPVDERGGPSRPPAGLEERMNRVAPPPSLQDRITSHPAPPSRAPEDRSARPAPAPEKRPPAAGPDDRTGTGRPLLPPDDRLSRPAPPVVDRDRAPARPGPRPADETTRRLLDDGPGTLHQEERRGRPAAGDRYRPGSPIGERMPPPLPPPPRGNAYAALPARSASTVRDDIRVPKAEPRSPSPRRLDTREYRPLPARNVSRERPDLRVPPRPDLDRGFNDDRRSDILDPDSSARLGESRMSYRRSPPLPPPPPAAARPPAARASWAREPAAYPPEDVERRFAPPEARRDWYDDREYRPDDRGYRDPDWDAKSRTWERDRPGVPPALPRDFERDRGIYEREPVMRSAWETAEERQRRPYSPTSAEPLRPLSSRLTEAYAEEHDGFPPRDYERRRYAEASPPPFSRIRPRSPSPMRRGPGPMDDLRPPMKRAREEPPYAGYYSPPRREPIPGAEYPSRPPTPPPPSTGSSYYDRSGYPASAGPRDREFLDARDRASDVGYGQYDRRPPVPAPRSPPGYGRGGFRRTDERRFSVPPS